MDACLEDLAVYIRQKVPRILENVGKKADLYLLARKLNLCDQPRRSTQAGARPVMDSVRLRELEKRLSGDQCTPYLCGEEKALCIPDAICDAIVGYVEGARGTKGLAMSVMVGAATTRAQTLRETATTRDVRKETGKGAKFLNQSIFFNSVNGKHEYNK
ncbi:hypothetical protein PoB_003867600 [Plakobranchus ocellatus]|uniref:Uncharacterized protein n=1 Tax=Plakobranchus ocellatus TaxID=259542 RepID=A0AAV4AVK0_9GAST|nr:hypothetical protein PoB_003867600 [Plakobranchus ocellatus]